MRALAAVLWFCLCGVAAAQPVTIATTGTFPPFLWEEGSDVRGFDIDLMDEICRRHGWTCEYRIFALMPGLEAVARGDADIALGGVGISEEREAYGDFTCPYQRGSIAQVPIFARDASVDPKTARIAVLADSLSHRDLERQGYTAVPYPDLADAIRSALTGETDAFHGNRGSLDLVPGAAEGFVEIEVLAVESGGPAFLVSSARPRLLVTLNDTLSVLHRDGQLEEIAGRWFGPGGYAPPANMGVACGPITTASAPTSDSEVHTLR